MVEKAAGLIGPFIVNDISAGEDDPGMLPAVGRLGLQYIAMHKRGTPSTMQSLCNYGNVTSEVLQYFRKFAERAEKAGIKDWILDPGFGFAKDIGQNWQLLRELEGLRTLGHRQKEHDIQAVRHHSGRISRPDAGSAFRRSGKRCGYSPRA